MPDRLLSKEDLQPNLLVQIGSDLYKVSNLDNETFTATHVYPIQPRTTVRRLGYDVFMHEPSSQIIRKYEDAWGFERGSTE